MEDFNEAQYLLLKEHQVHITSFPFKLKEGVIAYRFYFTDILTGYIFNPMREENGKKVYPYYFDYDEGLIEYVRAAQVYLNNNRNLTFGKLDP